MLYSLVAQAIALLALSWDIFDHWKIGIYGAIILFMTAFGVGMGGTMPLYSVEIVPVVGVAAGVALQWLASAFIAWFTPRVLDHIDIQIMIYFYVAWNIANFFFVKHFVLETTGLNKNQIAE